MKGDGQWRGEGEKGRTNPAKDDRIAVSESGYVTRWPRFLSFMRPTSNEKVVLGIK